MTKDEDGAGADNVEMTEVRRPSLTIDYDLYARYLEGSNLPDDQKQEFIETLWSIVVAFVDLGFGVHPVQHACEQNGEISDLPACDSPDVVGLQDQLPTTKSIKAAHGPADRRGMREES